MQNKITELRNSVRTFKRIACYVGCLFGMMLFSGCSNNTGSIDPGIEISRDLVEKEVAAIEAVDPLGIPFWLVGCWTTEQAETETVEVWKVDRDGNLIGTSQYLVRGEMVFSEVMRIVRNEDTMEYQVNPNNAGVTIFTMTSNTGKELIFENPSNDFPKKIRYWQESEKTLNAEISGGGKSLSWSWKRFLDASLM